MYVCVYIYTCIIYLVIYTYYFTVTLFMSEVRYRDGYNYILFTVFLFCMYLGVQKFISEHLFKFFDVITSIVSFLWEYTTAARDVIF